MRPSASRTAASHGSPLRRGLALGLAAGLALGPLPLATADEPAREVRVTATVVNVRAEPSPTGKVLFQLKQGDTAQVLDNAGRWWHVKDAAGRTGYVFGAVVTVVETAAPAPAPAATAAGAPLKIDHQEIGCIVADQYPRL